MKTVNEVSQLTGISVRTLHYYDEIGLLKPTRYSEAGYRLYDDKALDTLQQILFFREFDVPLKEIKSIMENPSFDKKEALKSQEKILELKRNRLNALISGIKDILRGENKMDFSVFDKTQIEEMYKSMVASLNHKQVCTIEEEFGNLDEYKRQYIENMGRPKSQKVMEKIIEWYGNENKVMNTSSDSRDPELLRAYTNRIQFIFKKLADNKEKEASSFEIKQIIGELDFVEKQTWQMEDVSKLMLDLADGYLYDEEIIVNTDEKYGSGTSAFIGKAIKEFYNI